MTAWERLKALSSLATGTAWQLLTNPRQGSGVVLNDGLAVALRDTSVAVALVPSAVSVALVPDTVAVALADHSISVELGDDIAVALTAPNTTVEVRP